MKKLWKFCTTMCLLGGLFFMTATASGCGSGTAETKTLEIIGENTVYVKGSTNLSVKSGGKNISETITFTSSNDEIATVNTNGRVSGVAPGEVTITAAAEGYVSATHVLNVLANTQTVTISITPTFAPDSVHTQVEDGYGIFFASSLDNWQTPILATYSTSTSTYDVILTDVAFGQTISYNTYYDLVDGTGWQFINTESVNNSSRSLAIEEGVLSYPVASTFLVPRTIEELVYHITIEVTGSTLNESVYVWVGSDANGWTLTRANFDDGLGVWVYRDTNVNLGYFEYSICLGSETSCNWSYESKKSLTVAEDTTLVTTTATYATQPDYSDPTYAYTITLVADDVQNSNKVEIVIDGDYQAMTDNGDGTYTIVLQLTAAAHTFYFYNWHATNVEYKIYQEGTTPFSITVAGIGSTTVNGSFVSGTGTIATE